MPNSEELWAELESLESVDEALLEAEAAVQQDTAGRPFRAGANKLQADFLQEYWEARVKPRTDTAKRDEGTYVIKQRMKVLGHELDEDKVSSSNFWL